MKKSILTIIAVAALCVVGQAQNAPTTFGIDTRPLNTLLSHFVTAPLT